MTRGPLPARVYWVRRLLVLGTAVLLVVAIARLLGGGSDAASEPEQAAQAAADASTGSTPAVDVVSTPSEKSGKGKKKKSKTPDPTPTLAVPVGECDDTDVAVTPVVKNAVAGRDVTVTLQLRTVEAEACTWAVGPGALTMNITSGRDDIWSSRDCPRVIPREPVVVRNAATSSIEVTWNAKRSDAECTRFTEWAGIGWYHVTASALGGEPSDVQFELATPTAATITRTASPTQQPTQQPTKKPGKKQTKKPGNEPTKKPSKKPSQSPSGAVEPD